MYVVSYVYIIALRSYVIKLNCAIITKYACIDEITHACVVIAPTLSCIT